ncbi:MAG: putative Ig domain-containing protein [Steroidobacteraceae bacterium]
MNSVRAICGLGLACLVLAGCGGSGSDSTPAAATADSSSPSAGSSSPAGSGSPAGSSSPPPSGGTTQSTPTISGQPATSVTAGQAYSFTPTATKPNGGKLTFAIGGPPAWASFNTSTGQISGTPSASAVGTYSNIVISVSDGTTTASLAPFAITVVQPASVTGSATLSWTPPTTNTDGTAITNLAGYHIYYGTNSNAMTQVVNVANVGVTDYVLQSLTTGTWYFAVKAYTTSGEESQLSNVASKTIS